MCVYIDDYNFVFFVLVFWECVCVCVFPGQGMVYWYLGISDRRYCYQQQNTGLIHTEQELYT